MAARSPLVAAATRLYSALLVLYPAAFRAEYGEEMTTLFGERSERARRRGFGAFTLCLAAASLDLIGGALADRVRIERPREKPYRGDPMSATLAQDLRIAVRSFWRQPIFTLTVIVTLAIGVGTTTAVFSVVNAAVLRPLPFPQADRIVSIVEASPRFGLIPFAPPYLHDFRDRARQFEGIAGFTSSWTLTLTGSGPPEVVTGAYISDGLLELLGVTPVSGRAFSADEQAVGGARVALVNEAFWRRHFGSVPLNAQMVRLDSNPVTVVGILPDTFKMPITTSLVSTTATPAEVWLPFAANEVATSRAVPAMNVVARVKPGVTVEQARAEMASVVASIARDIPAMNANTDVRVMRLSALVSAEIRRPLTLLLASVVLLLLIACANVGNMLLARSASRTSELAVRSSLGATRSRLVAQLLAESTVLSIAGGLLGTAVVAALVRLMAGAEFMHLPPSASVAVDPAVLAFSLLATVVTLLIVGLLPALQVSRGVALTPLAQGSWTIGDRGRRMRDVLVAAEVALAMVLLVAAGLLARSFWSLTHVNPGFAADRVLSGTVSLPAARYTTGDRRRAFVNDALGQLNALPGVEHAALVNRLPLGGNVLVGVEFEGQPIANQQPVTVDRRVVSPRYFAAMGIPVRAGRDFGGEDGPQSTTQTAIVNESLVRRYWSDERALGRRLRLMLRSGPGPWLQVVGVVGDVRHHGLDQPAQPEIYVPYAQAAVEGFTLVVRAARPLGLAPALRDTVQGLDAELPVRSVGVVSEAIDASVTEPRVRTLLFNTLASVGLVLVVLGIYGVVSYGVARRTREIGLRLALGAQPTAVVGVIVRRSMAVVGTGAIVGVFASFAVTRTMSGMLFGVAPTDLLTFVGVTALLFVVAFVAAYVPARAATRLDPVRALRVS